MKLLFTFLVSLLIVFQSFAQNESKWKFSVGVNIVDIRTPDDFSGFMKDYFNGSIQDLNFYSIPVRITAERSINDFLSGQLSGSYNEIKKGFNWSEGDPLGNATFFAMDGKLKYDLNHLFGETGFFDPFVLAGAGYSKIGDLGDLKIIGGYGFNLWFTDNVGLNLESSYNHNFKGSFNGNGTGTDFFQHNIGVIFKIGKHEKKIKDADGDGIEDRLDECPDVPGVASLNGCPEPEKEDLDADKDGILDAVDKCPEAAGIKENNGCPATDTDGDGIFDHLDKCPNEKGEKDTQGCPHVDSDGDNVPDHIDKCPKEVGEKSNNGCPVVVEKKDMTQSYIDELKQIIIYFDFDSYILYDSEHYKLDKMFDLIYNIGDGHSYVLEGNTDIIGEAGYNFNLSQKRSEAVYNYLISKGISKEVFSLKSLGESNPASQINSDENRRVEIKVN